MDQRILTLCFIRIIIISIITLQISLIKLPKRFWWESPLKNGGSIQQNEYRHSKMQRGQLSPAPAFLTSLSLWIVAPNCEEKCIILSISCLCRALCHSYKMHDKCIHLKPLEDLVCSLFGYGSKYWDFPSRFLVAFSYSQSVLHTLLTQASVLK